MNKIIKYIIVLIIILIIYNIIRNNYILKNEYFSENDNKTKFINYIKSNLKTNTKNLIIIPHTELGDAFVMNGAIRHYSTIYDKIIYICKGSYYDQISFMYSDNKNILIYPIYLGNEIYSEIVKFIPIDEDMINTFNNYKIDFIPMKYFKDVYNPIILSDTKIKTNNDLINYPFFMYDELNLDENIRNTKFKINRDHNKENELYNKLINIIGKEYIIIIDDKMRNYNIDIKYIQNKNLPIFYLGNNSQNTDSKLNEIKDSLIVNYIKILENAKEIHTIESSVYVLLDQLKIKDTIYVHAYTRNGNIDNKVNFYTKNKIFKYIYTN